MSEDYSTSDLPDQNLFMYCPRPVEEARTPLPDGFTFRLCRPEELSLWMAMPFESAVEAETHRPFMTEFFERVYAPHEELFYERCLFVCEPGGSPIGTGFVWDLYGEFPAVHWLKVRKEFEGRGIGRAILSRILWQREIAGRPIFLHTQPESLRALKLYADFGFLFLVDPVIGARKNHLEQASAYLEEHMDGFRNVGRATAPVRFLERLKQEAEPEF